LYAMRIATVGNKGIVPTSQLSYFLFITESVANPGYFERVGVGCGPNKAASILCNRSGSRAQLTLI
jgi:hypothetical protein